MVTRAIISFDTELSAGLHQRGHDARANFESSILGRCRDGDFGIHFQMDMLESYGLKGVFFVDPMPALVHGPSIIRDIVAPIELGRAHVCTPVTNAHLVCRLLLAKKKITINHNNRPTTN